MDIEKKERIVHYIVEFSIAITGIAIFIFLFWIKNFELSFTLISGWALLFNLALFFFWLWKSNYKN